ncbi:hypothetical protein D3C75_775650 [compost metagenome]
MLCRNKIIGSRANHHADMTGSEERINAVIRLLEQAAQRRNQSNVLAEKVKISDALRFRLLQRDGCRRHGGFKTEAKEHHFFVRILAG